MQVEALRTPDERFANLPGYDFEPHYIDDLPGFEGLRLHYVDEGPRDARVTFLCLHGEPSWAYLYRKMLPVFTGRNYRVVAPDFFGFGRSDKPVEDAVYTYGFHRDTLMRFFDRLKLSNVCVVGQDWGGILGLTLPHEYPSAITRLLVMNTGLPVGESPGEGFEAWKDYVANNPDFSVTGLMKRATPILSDAEAQAYGAPFPDRRYMAGVRRFPQLVMVSPEMEGVDVSLRAREFLKNDWAGDSFMAVGKQDPVLGPKVMEHLRATIKNCPEPMIVEDGGHFLQEWGEPVAQEALKSFGL
ncbi:MAG: haloalkane dehalogenase [Alphaproteobacteria bacterium]